MICTTCRHHTPNRTCSVALAASVTWRRDLEWPERCKHHQPGAWALADGLGTRQDGAGSTIRVEKVRG